MATFDFLRKEITVSKRAKKVVPLAFAATLGIGAGLYYTFRGETTNQIRNETYEGIVRQVNEKTGRTSVSYKKGEVELWCTGEYGELVLGQNVLVEIRLEEELRQDWRGNPLSDPILVKYSVVNVNPRKEDKSIENIIY